MIAPIRLEQLRHVITVKQETQSEGTFGQELSYTDFKASIRAFVQPTSGAEFYAAQKVNPEANYNVWVRFQSGFLPSMQVVFESKVFHILHVLEWEEKRRWIRLICKELV
jgi:SPP1 family predicted phage head-tail adaptor